MEKKSKLVPTLLEGRVENLILDIRGLKVILDSDLARLYGVSVGQFNRAVKRNKARFPGDFMFRISYEEVRDLRCQFGISKGRGGRRYLPYAFTEYGIAMLSSVLKSDRAINVNIEIMRTFGKLRHLLASHGDLIRRLDDMEKKYDENFRVVFQAIRGLIHAPEKRRKGKLGFETKV